MTMIDSLRRCDLVLSGDPPVATVEVAGTRVPLTVRDNDGTVSLRAEIGSLTVPSATPVEQYGLAAPGDTRFAMSAGTLIGSRTLVQPTLGDLYDAVFDLAKATCGLSQLLAGAESQPAFGVPGPRASEAPTQTIPPVVSSGPWADPRTEYISPPVPTGPPAQWEHLGPPSPPAGAGYLPVAQVHPATGRRLLATAMWLTLITAALGFMAGLVLVIVPLAMAVDGAAAFAAVGAAIIVLEAGTGVAAWLAGTRGNPVARIVVTVVGGLTVLAGIVDVVNGVPRGGLSLLFGAAIVVLWWLPPTTRAIHAKRAEQRTRSAQTAGR